MKRYHEFLGNSTGKFYVSVEVPGMPPVDPVDAHVRHAPEYRITLLYGVGEMRAPAASRLLAGARDGMATEMRQTGVVLWKSDRYDVISAEVEPEDVAAARVLLAEAVEHDDREYAPRCALAYVRPGAGDRYLDAFKEALGEARLKQGFLVYAAPSGNTVYLA